MTTGGSIVDRTRDEMTTTTDQITDLGRRWVDAELAADAGALDA